MIPRIHRRGSSFKGALGYVLHDPGKESSERVAWVETHNIYSHPDDAWFEMFDTYRNRAALKMNAGVDPRGRDNRTPVLHYTLSWHESDNPTPEHMRAMAFDSIKALGLSEHEAVMACHTDKGHHHVHVVVNTVHPYTGKTAPLKFSKLEFSRWAEAYEKEHGIHCEQRIKNNERRREITKLREAEREQAAFALLTGRVPPAPAPFEPVNDNSPNRRRWFERKDIIDKMKALRAPLEAQHRQERGDTWARQKKERRALDDRTILRLDAALEKFRDSFKDRWNALYRVQWIERDRIKTVATHPLERAVFVLTHRERLGVRGKKLSWKSSLALILNGRKLRNRVEQLQIRERKAVARQEKAMAKEISQRHWQMHRAEFHALRDRQAAERAAERAHQDIERKDIGFMRAKDELIREQDERARTAPVEQQREGKGPWSRRQPDNDRLMDTDIPLPPLPELSPDRPPPEGVPLAPSAKKGRRGKGDAGSPLMPGHVAARVPIVHPKRTVELAERLLGGKGKAPPGVPRAPDKQATKAQGVSKSFDEVARPDDSELKRSFRSAGRSGTRDRGGQVKPEKRAATTKEKFGHAARPDQPDKDTQEEARKERMQKDMERWRRRSARDDFERDR